MHPTPLFCFVQLFARLTPLRQGNRITGEIEKGLSMDMLERVLYRLRADHRSLRVIEAKSGVAFSILRYLRTGKTLDPRYSTVKKLHEFYRGRQ
jgi:hypothetical protein